MIKILLPIILILFVYFVWQYPQLTNQITPPELVKQVSEVIPTTPANRSTDLITPPESKILKNDYHIYQSFNNCGPAAMSMALSYFGINESQNTLGQALRPYQVPGGDNDDKSVTLQEIADKAKDYNLLSYRRPAGNIETIKLFITYDIPVITRTWLKKDDDIGHFRIIKGYNDNTKQLIQDDSLQGKNLRYSYDDFNQIWKKFNYEYLVLVPNDKKEIAEKILGEDVDFKTAWTKAVKLSEEQLKADPNDVYARFNLSVALFNTEDFAGSAKQFERVEYLISFRTLWYQIEPIQAYYQLGNYDRVFNLTERVLSNHNRAFSELYLLRGQSFLEQGNTQAAKIEFEKAVLYNSSLTAAREALESVK
jgi:tetratricopeptide (TPR) repeat protein